MFHYYTYGVLLLEKAVSCLLFEKPFIIFTVVDVIIIYIYIIILK